MNNERPRPVFVESASDNVPESIAKRKLMEKYLFFDESDVKQYFYKKRTLSDLEFLAYKRNLDNLYKVVIPLYRAIDKKYFDRDNFRNDLGSEECKADYARLDKSVKSKLRSLDSTFEVKENSHLHDVSIPYSKKRILKKVVPQSSFSPFSIFTDPLGLKKMSEHMPDVIQTIEEKLPDSEERSAFLDAFNKFQDRLPSMPKGFGSEVLESASLVFCGLTNLSPEILLAISSAWYAHSRDWVSYAFFVGCAIYFVIKLPDRIVYLINLYLQISEKVGVSPDLDMESVEPQMSDATLECVGSVIAAALIGVVGRGSKASAALLTLAFVKDFSRTRLGIIDLSKLVLGFVEKLVNFFRETFLSLPSVRFMDSCSKEIDEFSKDVRLYVYRFNRGVLPMNEVSYSCISCLIDVGRFMLRTIPKDKHSEASLRGIHEDCNSLKKILIELERCDISLRGLRQEPVGILLSGGPGTAKSIAMNYLSEILARDSLSEDEKDEFEINSGSFIYSRKQENVFFDGLTNRVRVILYDDFLQARDVAGNPACEAMEIIRMLNSEEYNAHMAHLENKGNVYIRPKFVILTTNQPDLTSNAIISNIAMKRRFDLSYIVTPKPRFVRDEDVSNDLWNQRMDKRKLPMCQIQGLDDPSLEGELVTDLRPDQLDYHEYDLNTKQVGATLQFEEVVARARKAELAKRKQFALHRENFKTMVKKFSRIYDSEVMNEEVPDDYECDPDNESDEEDNEGFIDSFDATPMMRKHIESLLVLNPEYTLYLHGLTSRHHIFRHNDDMIDILLDEFGYHQLVSDLTNEKQYPPDIFRYTSVRKFKHAKRGSVMQIIDNFLSMVPGWNYVKNFIISNTDAIVSVLAFIAGSSFLVFVAKWLYAWFTGKPAPQSFGFSDKMRGSKAPKSYYKDHAALKQAIVANPQFGEDSSGIDLISSIVRRNCWRFETLREDGTWNVMGTFTFVKGRIGIIPYHFILKLMNGVEVDRKRLKTPVRFSHGNKENDPGLLFTVEEILHGHITGALADKDLVLVEMPRRFPDRPDIVRNFAKKRDLEHNQTNLEIVLPNVSRDRGYYFGRGHRFHDIISIDEKHVGFHYLVEETFCYDIPTQPGDCGSIMCILNPALQQRKIFGIHVAGQTRRGDGFAAVITQEELLADLKLFEPQIVSEEIELIAPQCSDLDIPVRFEILGRTELVCTRNTSSDIRKSRMYGRLGDNGLSPAALRPFLSNGTLIDPLLNAQRKYCQPDILIDYDIVRNCCNDYFAYCEWNETFTVDRRIFSTYEAIYGLESDIDFGSISSSTSAGWPNNVQGCRDYKKELFSYDPGTHEHDLIYNEVCAKVKVIEDKAKAGVRMFHVFTDNLKDELRENEKVASGSTRLFSGCEFHYLIAFRKYFGAFSLWYMKNKIKNGSAIGSNPYSLDWTSIAKRLIGISISNILAGDHEKYDGSQKPIIHLLILDDINKWYGNDPIGNLVRSILWMEVYNSRHICDGVIYEWLSGLPSGHPFTIIINTIYNHIIARYVWFRSTKSYLSYNENTYLIVQGDDLAGSVTDAYKDRFNDVVFAKYAAELGMKYTNETKSGEMIALRNLSEIEFLKRSFVFDPNENLYVAPLRLRSILKMVDWTKRKHKVKIVCDNVVTCIKELSLHEREVFDFYSEQIIKSFRECYPFEHTHEPLDIDFFRRREQVLNSPGFY